MAKCFKQKYRGPQFLLHVLIFKLALYVKGYYNTMAIYVS